MSLALLNQGVSAAAEIVRRAPPKPPKPPKLSDSDEWATPDAQWHELHKRYRFGFDLAASSSNSKCGLNFFSKADNALEHDWARLSAVWGWLWLNPPFSKPNLDHFTDKVRDEAERGAHLVAWLPSSTSSQWFHRNLLDGGDITGKRSIRGGLLRGSILELDFNYFRLELNFLRYRPQHRHSANELDAEHCAKNYGSGLGGIVIAAFQSKRVLR